MTLQDDMDRLHEAWRDLGYELAKTTGLLRLLRWRGVRLKPWVIEREQRDEKRTP